MVDCRYNWNVPMQSQPYGHVFSQVVWKSSLTIGFGVASRNGHTTVICFYYPSGNVPTNEQYRENVFPPLKP